MTFGLSRGQAGGVSERGFPAIRSLLRGPRFIMFLEESTQEEKALHEEK